MKPVNVALFVAFSLLFLAIGALLGQLGGNKFDVTCPIPPDCFKTEEATYNTQPQWSCYCEWGTA